LPPLNDAATDARLTSRQCCGLIKTPELDLITLRAHAADRQTDTHRIVSLY